MSEKDLKSNLDFVLNNRENLLKEHRNKYLLVFEEKFVDAFDEYERAAAEGVRLFGIEADFFVHYLVEKEPLNFVWEALL
ncbi:MAG: hypothetical protein HQ591_13370 [candidate division Zixibacteria bacterium]|nr:hypothetical protein [Candidatus Tariuqbacter arcticus]